MNRREFLLKVSEMFAAGISAMAAPNLWAQASVSSPASSPAVRGKPEVLFINVHDTEAKLLSCYGGPAKTPNLEKLAARGMIFDHAYCSAPVCNPARASIVTGLRPPTNKTLTNNQDWRVRMPAGDKTIMETFQANGYTTMVVGGVEHGRGKFHEDGSSQANKREDAMWDKKFPAGGKKTVKAGNKPKGPFPGELNAKGDAANGGADYVRRACSWGDSGMKANEEPDYKVSEVAAKELPVSHEKPRFFGIGMGSPHYSLRAPKEYMDMYSPADVKLPPKPKQDMSFLYSGFNTTEAKWLSDDEKREIRAAYYACITYMDMCVGRILDALKKSGKEDSTIVCFWADHGFQQGENNLWQKDMLFEPSCRVPLIIAGPGIAQGKRCDRLVETVDLYPTLCDLCGIEIPPYLEGTSMKPLLQNPDLPWKKATFTWCQTLANESMRTVKWRYSEFRDKNVKTLYDMQNDPEELDNLADNPKYADVVKQLHEQMQAGWKAARPE